MQHHLAVREAFSYTEFDHSSSNMKGFGKISIFPKPFRFEIVFLSLDTATHQWAFFIDNHLQRFFICKATAQRFALPACGRVWIRLEAV